MEQALPGAIGHDGCDGSVLPGRGSGSRRKGTRHDGDAADLSGPPFRDCHGQVHDGHGLQSVDGSAEHAEHGDDRSACAVDGREWWHGSCQLPLRSVADVGDLPRLSSVGALQCDEPGSRDVCQQQQGRSVLPDSPADGDDGPDDVLPEPGD